MGKPFNFRSSDGRLRVGRVEGPADGDLIFFHTGTPGTCHLYGGFIEEGAKRGLRHATCLRPGYGEVPAQRGRSLTDCASDAGAVADFLGVDRIYVVGHSGGAPHALACGAALPELVISVAAVAGFAPLEDMGVDAWIDGMGNENRDEFIAFQEGDEALKRFIRRALDGMGGADVEGGDEEPLSGSLSRADCACLEKRSFRDYQAQSYKRVSEDDIEGWFDDVQALWGPWDLDLSDITAPVTVWHGAEDKLTPVSHGRWIADRIAGARFNPRPTDGHMSIMVDRYGEILEDLIAIGQ